MPCGSRPVVAALLALAALAGCSRTGHPTFPPPARPPLFVQLDFETVFNQLRSMLEARSYPLVIEDERFGSVRTDWVYFGPGEVDVRPMADCPAVGTGGGRVRARFGFDVRRRTIQSTVTLLSHWQVERLAGFDRSDRGFVDCRSTGEWERMIEATLTQRRTIP